MNESSKVSIICLCHNQGPFVVEAIQSALNQSHSNVEVILVDDGSTDESKQLMREMATKYGLIFIDLPKPLGNCKAFNKGFRKASGDYVIDLAADDQLATSRVSEGLRTFEEKDVGVEFCNVQHIDISGNPLSLHFEENVQVPEGDLYQKLITTYFISPPGMMIKREVLDMLNGYDESLSYEDFDFWIRSSRNFHYGYTDKVLVLKRDVPNSHSKQQFQFLSRQQRSTFRVCQKIKALNQSTEEQRALRARCFYEIRNCIRQGHLGLIFPFFRLTI